MLMKHEENEPVRSSVCAQMCDVCGDWQDAKLETSLMSFTTPQRFFIIGNDRLTDWESNLCHRHPGMNVMDGEAEGILV